MYSKYIDESKDENGNYNSMDKIINNILDYENWHDPIIDPITKKPIRYEVSKSFEDDKKIEFGETEFKFNYIKYSYDKIIKDQGENPVEAERLRTTSGAFVIYTDGKRTQYIIDKARNNNALSILRYVNNSEKNKVIEAARPFKFTEDLSIWLISRFMNDNKVIDEDHNLEIERITGFKGSGEEDQARLAGSGNEVMNLFSSITFLIEMDSMTEIGTRFKHGKSTFDLFFHLQNSQLDINLESYIGNYMFNFKDEKSSQVLLESFIDIVPTIMHAYDADLDSGDWNNEVRKEFIQQLAGSVKDKLDSLVKEA